MKKALNIFGYFLVGLSIVFLFMQLFKHFREIPHFVWGYWAVLNIILAVVFSAITVAVNAYIWVILLRGGGVFLTLRNAFITLGQAQIGKYLPGNVFQYVGRFVLGRKQGLPREAIVLSMGVETLLVLVTALAIGVIGSFFEKAHLLLQIKELSSKSVTLTLLAVFSFVAVLIIVVIVIPEARDWIRLRLPYLHFGRVSISVFLYLAVFIMYGVFLSLLLRSLWDVDSALQWYQFTWGFALAWVVGFITPGAPGGIGVREAIFILLFSQDLGPGLAASLTVVLRVVTSLGDLVAFGFAYWLRSITPENKGLLSSVQD